MSPHPDANTRAILRTPEHFREVRNSDIRKTNQNPGRHLSYLADLPYFALAPRKEREGTHDEAR